MMKLGIRILITSMVLFLFSCTSNKKISEKETELLTKETFDENLLSNEAYLKLKSQIDNVVTINEINEAYEADKKNKLIAKPIYHFERTKTVTFGSYFDSATNSQIIKPIEWYVLDKKENRALLFSKYILDNKKYDFLYVKGFNRWDNSALRYWLNGEFVDIAFNNAEKEIILDVEIVSKAQTRFDEYFKDYISKDKVFLLSSGEVSRYLEAVEKKGALLTDYTLYSLDGRNSSDEVEWWLRDGNYTERRTEIRGYDSVYVISQMISKYTTKYSGVHSVDEVLGIRPAIWVKYSN